MKFLLDHDVPDDLSYLLEELGHDVMLLRKGLPRDSSDEAVFLFVHEAGRILLTCNRNATFFVWPRPSHITVWRCSGRLSVRERRASETTSISPDTRGNHHWPDKRKLKICESALDGMLDRARPEGCVVSITQMVRPAEGAAHTARTLRADFGNDPRFHLNFIENAASGA